jgi:hypothetical protein
LCCRVGGFCLGRTLPLPHGLFLARRLLLSGLLICLERRNGGLFLGRCLALGRGLLLGCRLLLPGRLLGSLRGGALALEATPFAWRQGLLCRGFISCRCSLSCTLPLGSGLLLSSRLPLRLGARRACVQAGSLTLLDTLLLGSGLFLCSRAELLGRFLLQGRGIGRVDRWLRRDPLLIGLFGSNSLLLQRSARACGADRLDKNRAGGA